MVTWFAQPSDGAISFQINVQSAIPAVPSNLRAGTATDKAISLIWQDNSNNEDGFKVYRWRGEDQKWLVIGTVGSGITQFTDTNVQCGQGYAYYVSAFNSSGESNGTAWISASTKDCPQPPNQPTNLNADDTIQDMIDLRWQDNSNNEEGFKIYKWGLNGTVWDFYYLTSVGANTTMFVDTGLTCGASYWYQVSAYNSTGESTRSDWVQGTTTACSGVAPNRPSQPSPNDATSTPGPTTSRTVVPPVPPTTTPTGTPTATPTGTPTPLPVPTPSMKHEVFLPSTSR